MLLVGDAGGLVNPFNGEGIAYAMESAAIASRCAIQSLARRGTAAEKALEGYPVELRQALGGYYRIGNLFSRLIGNPTIMGLATRHGLPRRTLMEFLLKLLANLYDPRDGATSDRVITAMARLAPSV
jgi:flavin-dependent dehydrogenase